MICNNCGNSIQTFNRFCPKCGAPVQFQTPSSGPAQFNSPQAPMYAGPRCSARAEIELWEDHCNHRDNSCPAVGRNCRRGLLRVRSARKKT